MRNTPKLRLFNHLLEHRHEINNFFDNNSYIPFKELPDVKHFENHHEEVLRFSIDVLNLKYVSAEAVMHVMCQRSSDSNSCDINRMSLKTLKYAYAEAYQELRDNGFQDDDNYIYVLNCQNPNQSKNLDNIITHFLDAHREGITFRFRKNYRTIIWAVTNLGGIVDGEGYNFTKWFTSLDRFVEIIGKDYKCY